MEAYECHSTYCAAYILYSDSNCSCSFISFCKNMYSSDSVTMFLGALKWMANKADERRWRSQIQLGRGDSSTFCTFYYKLLQANYFLLGRGDSSTFCKQLHAIASWCKLLQTFENYCTLLHTIVQCPPSQTIADKPTQRQIIAIAPKQSTSYQQCALLKADIFQ